jgi:integrase/recombinase XerD
MFLGKGGKPLTSGAVEHMLYDLGKAAGIPRLQPRLLRHTSATQYLLHGGDVISLQRKLWHSGPEMTNRYAHLASDQLAATQERVAPMDRTDVRPMKVPKSG